MLHHQQGQVVRGFTPAEKSRTSLKHAASICSGLLEEWRAMSGLYAPQTVLVPFVLKTPTIRPYRETTNRRAPASGGTHGKSVVQNIPSGTPVAVPEVTPRAKHAAAAGAGAGVLHLAVGPRASHDQRDVLPRCGAFAEQPVRMTHQLGQRQILARQCAKRRVQVLISMDAATPCRQRRRAGKENCLRFRSGQSNPAYQRGGS